MATIEKRTNNVGVSLNDSEYSRVRAIIEGSSPEMAEDKLLRLATLHFVDQVEKRGMISVLADVLGA